MMHIRPRRSALYLPASNDRAIEKARRLDCDVVILDLEDAVAPELKSAARPAVLDTVAAADFGERELVIRVNGLDTPWGRDDLAALAQVSPATVLVPKVSTPDDLAGYRSLLPETTPLWAMIETCGAILNLSALSASAACHGLTGLVVGTNDLAKEMHAVATPDRRVFHSAFFLIVAAARAAGIAVLDGVCNAIDDTDRLAAECLQARQFGFDGKTLIHPAQIATANAAFSPSDEELTQARAIIAAFEDPANAGKAALRVAGTMVEQLHCEQALRLIAMQEAIQDKRA